MSSPPLSPPPSEPTASQHQIALDLAKDEEDDISDQSRSVLPRPPELAPFGPSPPFSSLVHVLERVRDVQGMEAKRKTLSSFFDAWRKRVGLDLFPIIRLLIPERDKERSVYGLKEEALAKCYVRVLGLDPKKTEAGRRLVSWKQPTGRDNQVTGDFASVLYEVVSERTDVAKSSLSIDQVHELLDQLSKARGEDAKAAIVHQLYLKLEAKDQRWLVRIILKDLKITVKERSILEVFHPDAMSLFNVTSDLRNVCFSLPDPSVRIEKERTKITLSHPLLPQLSQRGSPNLTATAKAMGKDFMIEEKLDGERIQIHRVRGNQYYVWSRKGKDYTYLYGKNQHEGSLMPFIHSAFRDDVADCILDGEMLAYDPELDRCLPFGSLKNAALDKSENGPHPCFKVFDILYLRGKGASEGVSLANTPLWRRKIYLEGGYDRLAKKETRGVITEVPGRIEFPYRKEGANTAEDIRTELHAVMERKGEGLILKHPGALYEAGGRNKQWVKVKPDYFDELGENCDLAVLGGWWGTGSRGGKISGLLLGLRCDGELDAEGNPIFATFAKIGSGMNVMDYAWITKYHSAHFKPFDRDKKAKWPTWIKFSSFGYEDKPDVWIHPNNTFVCTVKASEVVPSADFGMGLTLRFPRCKYIRFDLATKEIMQKNGANVDLVEPEGLTVEEWKEFRAKATREITMSDAVGNKRKSKASTSAAKRAKLPSTYQGLNAISAGIQVKDQIFAHHKFFVVTDGPGIKKQALEKLIFEHGGLYKQDGKLEEDWAVFGVASKLMARTNGMDKAGKVDILRPEWILDSVKRGKALPLFEKYVLKATSDTRKSPTFSAAPDTFVDSSSDDDTGEEDVKEEEDDDVKPFDPFLDGRKKEAEQGKETFSRDEWLDEADPSLNDEFKREKVEPNEWDFEADGDSDATEDESLPEHFRRLDVADQPRLGGDDEDVKMYDPELIFKHLRFYLDDEASADEAGLDAPDLSRATQKELDDVRKLLISNGGTITTNIDDPLLTHAVLADFSDARFKEIYGAVNQRGEKHRHIVPTGWVTDSVKEETLQAESKYLV